MAVKQYFTRKPQYMYHTQQEFACWFNTFRVPGTTIFLC